MTFIDAFLGSFQLSYLGLGVVLRGLVFDTLADTSEWQTPLVLSAALTACRRIVDFTTSITQPDKDLYWAACT